MDIKAYKIKGEKFEGNPCEKCESTTRYVRGGACVKCKAAYSSTYRKTPKGLAAGRASSKKRSDIRWYGSTVDGGFTDKRRQIEDRQEKTESLYGY